MARTWRCFSPAPKRISCAISVPSRKRSPKKPHCGSPGPSRRPEFLQISKRMQSANSASAQAGSITKSVRLMRPGQVCASREENPPLDSPFLVGYIPYVEWQVEYTDEFDAWWDKLSEEEQI